MPYRTTEDLPDSVKNVLPQHAQEIYKEAFNSAYEEYKNPDDRRDHADREETAHLAWGAVKHSYEKDEDDKWRRK